MADLLAVEVALRHFGWSVQDWDEKLYEDCPSVQIKLPVTDRSKYKTTWAETQLLEPEGLQARIDAFVKDKGDGARAFVRYAVSSYYCGAFQTIGNREHRPCVRRSDDTRGHGGAGPCYRRGRQDLLSWYAIYLIPSFLVNNLLRISFDPSQ